MGKANAENKVLPLPKYKSLKVLDRYRNLCLWLPVTVASKSIPWGYKISPDNSALALPDEKALACFIKAREYLEAHSYQVVADWLGSCGFPIGAFGLTKVITERPFWPEINLSYEERLKL